MENRKRSRSDATLLEEYQKVRSLYTDLGRLPGDIIMKILTEAGLSIIEMHRLCSINKHWKRICENNDIWQKAFEKKILGETKDETGRKDLLANWNKAMITMPNAFTRLFVFGYETWIFVRDLKFRKELYHPIYWTVTLSNDNVRCSINNTYHRGDSEVLYQGQFEFPPEIQEFVDHFELKWTRIDGAIFDYRYASYSYREIFYYLLQHDWTFDGGRLPKTLTQCSICAQPPTILCGCSCEKVYCGAECQKKDH